VALIFLKVGPYGALQALDSSFPVIDIHPLIAGTAARDRVAKQIGQACREYGFFFIVGHGVDEELQQRLERLSRQFFAQAIERKLEIRMALGGRAWRGYFPVGGELTSGRPDLVPPNATGSRFRSSLIPTSTPRSSLSNRAAW